MSDVTDNRPSDLQFLDALNTTGDLYLIRQTTTGRMLTGRRVNEGQAAVYQRLQIAQAPHTPQVRDIRGEVDGQVLILEDYIPGVALSMRLEQGLYEGHRAAAIGAQLCEALAALHCAGLVHRDIKPENVIVTDEDRAYLIDFDIMRLQKGKQSHDTIMLGTTGYAAPEQYGFVQTDARADIYALGVLLNRMVTGVFPQDALAAPPLRQVIQKCTEMDPDNRYQTAAELRRALQQCVGNTERTQADRRCSQQDACGMTYATQDTRRKNIIGPGIPGFRGGNVWHAIVAVAFYIVASIVLTALLVVSFRSALYFFIGIPILIGCVGTFMFAFDIFWLRTRCTWVESQRASRWYGGYCLGVILLQWFACLVVMIAAVAILGG